jgi:hypothetical protein
MITRNVGSAGVSLPRLVEVPAGAIMAMSRATSDRKGWLTCDGSLVSIDLYQRLYAVIGHAFNGGASPGGNQFRLPNLNGAHVRGATSSSNIGATGGSDTHTHDWSSAASATSSGAAVSDFHSLATYGGTIGDYGTIYNANHYHGYSGATGTSSGTGLINRASGNTSTPTGLHSHGSIGQGSTNNSGHGHSGSFINNGSTHTHSVSIIQDVRSSSAQTPNPLSGSSVPHHLPMVYVIKT